MLWSPCKEVYMGRVFISAVAYFNYSPLLLYSGFIYPFISCHLSKLFLSKARFLSNYGFSLFSFLPSWYPAVFYQRLMHHWHTVPHTHHNPMETTKTTARTRVTALMATQGSSAKRIGTNAGRVPVRTAGHVWTVWPTTIVRVRKDFLVSVPHAI